VLTQRYSVSQPPIQTLFTLIKEGEIAIPEIQRPFVWDATKVRNFLDSLFQRFPVGYLITWRNPDVKLKDGTTSGGKRILIDGQQRVTALMAALLGQEVIDKDYRQVRIRIAFHPVRYQFEVYNPAIAKDPSWIPDIATIFDPHTSLFSLVTEYCDRNPGSTRDDIFRSVESLRGITSNQIGLIELDSELDIETVTEIFIRVNSEGVPLSQADFAMSKIAANETYGGNTLRKAIDYFCHLSVAPEFYNTLKKDETFATSEFFPKMAWLQNENDDLYDPSYTDMLRVAFTSEFRRGRLQDLVALLSGRNFETRHYEETIVEDSFNRLKNGVLHFINENNFKTFIMIIRSAGFVDSSLIGSRNALNFAYILYLVLRKQGLNKGDIEYQVRRWFVMSILLGRYSSSPETMFDYDIRQIHEQGIDAHAASIIKGELSEAYWETTLPRELNTSVASSPYFRIFRAAQVKLDDHGFLSKDIKVRELVEVKSDIHHIFPRDYLKKRGLSRGQYNQVANYAITQSEINIAIGNKEPQLYFTELLEQCNGGPKKYGNITSLQELHDNYKMNCLPQGMEKMIINDYPEFLQQRRQLMAQKIKQYFFSL
jgi:hypothetical protein